MRLKIFFRFLLSLYIVNCTLYIDAQAAAPTSDYTQQTDTNKTKPVQIRRGIELKEGYQSYEQYYSGKDMAEEKRSHFPHTGTGTWTELNPKVPRVTYIGLDFINPDTGWACGGSGAIIKTTNGGDDWTISETPVTNLLLKIHSYNGQVVICTGYDGLILRSSDGGETFEQIVSGVGNGTDLWGVQMLNDTLGWVCGMNQTLLKTTDAGLSWQQLFPGLNQHYWSLNFLDESYGMIACGGGIILKTTDGGQSWAITQAGDIRSLYTIDIIDSLHITAAGFDGKNVYSDDGGTTWVQNTDVPAFSAINWIDFIDTDTGYCVRDVYDIAKTTNRGQNWFNPNTEVVSEWHIQLLDDGTGYSCGEEVGGSYALNFFKRTNGLENWSKIFLNDNFSDVFFLNEQEGFVISGIYSGIDSRGLYKTIDGGYNWELVVDAPDGVELLFIDSLTGFIGGSNAIYKTIDGGDSWYTTNGTTGAGKIFFINETKGWAIHSGTIYITTNTGENWTAQHTLPADSYTGIFFIDSLNGWATSTYIWQTTDGGVNWVERTDIPAVFCNGVYFFDLQKGWILAENKLYKTNNGGLNWSLDPQIYTYTTDFGIISKTHFIITGSNIYETVDTGQVWQNITSYVGTLFSRLNSPTAYLAFAIGPFGLVLQYLDTSYVPVELSSFYGSYISNNIELKWTTETELNNSGFEILRSTDLTNWETIGFVPGRGTTTSKSNYTFYDSDLIGNHFFYKLKQIDFDGSYSFSEIIRIEIQINNYSLSQNYPNPSNPKTRITFSIAEKTNVKINLYSITGELIKELVDEEKENGIYQIDVDLNNYSSGMYFYRMTTNSGYTATKKLILLK
ncbi:MAG: T9SS type A sorting domain-containing protein [Ignavibacteriales bacterium]|nr:T9SS type A sorting domain-containing protein [Ignavibacteriales bacterium]